MTVIVYNEANFSFVVNDIKMVAVPVSTNIQLVFLST